MATDYIPNIDAISDILFPVYKKTLQEWSSVEDMVKQDLREARMDTNVEVYLSRSMVIGMFIGVIFWSITTIIGFMAIRSGAFEMTTQLSYNFPDNAVINVISKNKEWIVLFFTGLLSALVGMCLILVPAIAWPKLQAKQREREINLLLADTIAYMHALSIGGMNRLEVIEAAAEAEGIYGEASKEFQSIMNEMEYFDADFKTAIQNQIEATPSDEFSQFLTDMVSIIDSGGNMQNFLNMKQEKYIRISEETNRKRLDTIELMGEMYMTLSLFPLLLIIILIIMKMMGNNTDSIAMNTVYGLIPLINVGVLVVLSTVKEDKVGSGYLENPKGEIPHTKTRVFNFPIMSNYSDSEEQVFKKAWRLEHVHNIAGILKQPHVFFTEHPLATFVLTIPAALIVIGVSVWQGYAPTTLSAFQDSYYWSTIFYLYIPFYVLFVPYAVFDTIRTRYRGKITNNLTETLEKLKSVNETGQTLLESIRSVSESSSGRMARELEVVYGKVSYDTKLKAALVEFNNKYKIPRLARTIKLIIDAQETSEDITEVLATTAEMNRNQDNLEKEQRTRTMTQVVIILAVYLTLLAVMLLLKVKFLSVMASLTGATTGGGGEALGTGGSFGGIDPNKTGMLFFHALTFQALGSSFLAGYIRSSRLATGLKVSMVMLALAGICWFMVL